MGKVSVCIAVVVVVSVIVSVLVGSNFGRHMVDTMWKVVVAVHCMVVLMVDHVTRNFGSEVALVAVLWRVVCVMAVSVIQVSIMPVVVLMVSVFHAVVVALVVGNIISVETMSHRDSVHLLSEEDFGESKSEGVSEFVVVLILPLCHGIHELMVNVLTIDDQVVVHMEDEVPWVGKGLAHVLKLVKVGSNSGLTLLKLSSNVSNDGTEIFDGVENTIEGSMAELVNDSTDSLPDMLGITKAFDTMWDLSLDSTCEKTLEDLAHSEEGEVYVGCLHGFESVHLVILLVVNLVEQLLPVVVEVEEELLVLNHLSLAVQKHGGSLSEVLTRVKEVAHSVVVETLTHVLKDVDAVDNDAFSGLKEELLWVKESLSHSLDLLIVVVINLSAVVEHVTDVRD